MTRRVKRLLHFLLQAAMWLGAWLLFTGKFTRDELLVGVVCALVAALASEMAWGTHLTAFGADPRTLAQAYHLPLLMLSGTVEIFKVLFRHLFTRKKAGSLMLAVDFDCGALDDPHDAARRALAIGYTTMTPSSVVLGIDEKKGRMLYHQLRPSPVPRMTRKLGARP